MPDPVVLKKLLTILLLFCIFLEVGGYYFIYQFNRQLIRKEVKSYLALHANEFEQTEFNFATGADGQIREAVKWENAEEFSYQNEMYDVIEKRTGNKTVYIRCVKDEKEDILITNFRHLIGANRSKENPSGNTGFNLLSLLNSPFLPAARPNLPPVLKARSIYCFETTLSVLHPSRDIMTPPPRQVLLA